MENHDEAPLEVMQPSAIMAMEKAQIDMQIATAHQYPRSLELFKKRALSMATLDPETADSCIYLRPVGKENGKQRYAEGPSIRLAEIVAVSYGNLRAASKVIEQTERYVKCAGMAHDLESNTAMSADCIESTVTKEGHPYSERQRALVAKVCGAKALRDAIFKCVPRALCKPIMEAAKKVAAGQDKSLDERRKKAQAWVGTLKIDEKRVFAALDVSGWTDVTAEHLITLTGLRTAMADGDENIESAFPPLEAKQDPHKPAATGHQQATQKTEPKKPQEAPKPESATQTPSASENKPTEAPANGNKPPEKPPETTAPAQTAATTSEPTQKPETTQENATEDPERVIFEQVPGETTQQPQAGGEKPPFVVNPNETAELQQVRKLLYDSNKTEQQVIEVLRKNKAMRDEQKTIAELSTKKHLNIVAAWSKLVPQMV